MALMARKASLEVQPKHRPIKKQKARLNRAF